MARLRRPGAASVWCCCILIAAVAAVQAQQQTFLDVLRNDPAHKLIVRAIDADKEGKIKEMLTRRMPITVLVPTDSALFKASVKLRNGRPLSELAPMAKNTCLITAVLKQHIMPGVHTVAQLRRSNTQASMLVTKKWNARSSRKVSVNWPLKLRTTSEDELAVASVANSRDPANPERWISATNGTIVEPFDVRAGGGIMHNVNALLLPTTNLTKLIKLTGCAMPVE